MGKNLEEHQSSYRYERKYLIPKSKQSDFLKNLYSAKFVEAYPLREINNIYFDDFHLKSFYENEEGVSDRTKYRVRWYGKKFEKSKKFFEFKFKSEFLNRKKIIDMGSFGFKNPLESNVHYLNNLVRKITFKKEPGIELKPILYNNYFRMYFYNQKLDVRITIDYNLNYFSFLNKNLNDFKENLIIEIKYDKKNIFSFEELYDLELTKNSKYVEGVKLTMDL